MSLYLASTLLTLSCCYSEVGSTDASTWSSSVSSIGSLCSVSRLQSISGSDMRSITWPTLGISVPIDLTIGRILLIPVPRNCYGKLFSPFMIDYFAVALNYAGVIGAKSELDSSWSLSFDTSFTSYMPVLQHFAA